MFWFRILRKRIILFILKSFRNRRSPLGNTLPILAVEYIGRSSVGTGKPLFVDALASAFAKENIKVSVCIEKRTIRQTILVSGDMTKKKVGVTPEEVVVSQHVPTWVCRNLTHAVRSASDSGVDLVIAKGNVASTDLSPFFSIAVIDGEYILDVLLGNVFHKLMRADAIVVLGDYEQSEAISVLSSLQQPVYYAKWGIEFDQKLLQEKLLGFSGLNCAGSFYKLLVQTFPSVSGFIPLLSKYSDKYMNRIIKIAKSQKVQMITTDQDFEFLSSKMKKQVQTCKLMMRLDDGIVECALDAYRNIHGAQDNSDNRNGNGFTQPFAGEVSA